jgi:hypothetical protein
MNRGILFLQAILCIIFFSCTGKKTTFVHKGIVAFRQGDQTWVSSEVKALYYEDHLAITAFLGYPSDGSQEELSIIAVQEDFKDHYTLNTVNHIRFKRTGQDQEFSFDSNLEISEGELSISEIDSTRKVLSGKFCCRVIARETGDTLYFKNGIFKDIPFESQLNRNASISGVYVVDDI